MHAIELEAQSGERHRVVSRQHGVANWKPLDNNVTVNEFELLGVLFDAGFEVPAPLYLDCSNLILASPYLVTEYIHGTTSIPDQDPDHGLRQMAAFLGRLHGLDPTSMAIPHLPAIEDPVQGALRYLPTVGVDRSILATIGSMRASTTAKRLLHGDFWPGNILWNQGRLVAVLDWEDASFGDPMADLACCRVELFCQYGREVMDSFTESYLGNNTFETSDLPLWEIYVSCSALAQMPHWGLAPREEERRAKMTRVFLGECANKLLS